MRVLPVALLYFIIVNTLSVALENKHYAGYQVFRAKATTKQQRDALADLQRKGKFDFWNSPSSIRSTDIMASPEEISSLKDVLKKHGISYSLMIKDVEPIATAERRSNLARMGKQPGKIDWIDYHSYVDIVEWIDGLPAQYPNLVTVGNIGQSFEGRDVKFVKISNTIGTNTTKTTVFMDGGFHSREWISPATVTYFINEILTKPDEYGDILQHVDFYIVPVVNPDGYEYSRTGDRMWRKNISKDNKKMDCVGVDINRNFDLDWGGPGSSDDKCSAAYKGPKVFSEIEARNIRDIVLHLVKTANLQLYITVHSYGQYILIPWSATAEKSPQFYDEMEAMAERAADALADVHGVEYTVGQSSIVLSPIAGCSDDWAKNNSVRFAFTFELRDTGTYGFILPPKLIIPVAEETVAAFKDMSSYFVPGRKLRKIKKRYNNLNASNSVNIYNTSTLLLLLFGFGVFMCS